MGTFDENPVDAPGAISELDGPSGIPLDEWLQRRRPPQQRWLGAAAGALAVVVLLVVLRSAWPSVLPALRPPSTSPALSTVVLLHSNITAGTLVLNDTKQPFQPGMQVTLHPGANTLTLLAPPFNPLQCVIIAPPVPGDGNCESNFSISQGTGYAPVINLNEGLSTLPAPQQQLVRAAVQQVLTSATGQVQASVAPGEHYGTGVVDNLGYPQSLIATVPLRASLFATLAYPQACGNGTNPLACSTGFLRIPYPTTALHWIFQVPARFGWHFTNSITGQVTSDLLPDQSQGNAQETLRFDLVYAPTGTWSVNPANDLMPNLTQQLSGVSCDIGITQMLVISGQGSGSIPPTILPTGPATAAGCAITVQMTGTWHYLDLFGVLLAADRAAQQALPMLALATPAEIKAVAQGG